MQTLKIALLGFGNAGQALAKMILEKHQEIVETFGYSFQFTAIATATKGCLIDPMGIDLKKVLGDIARQGYFDKTQQAYTDCKTLDILEKADYDVLIEITPLCIFTGQPAIDHIRTAFQRKKHVITANKGPIAWAHRELKKMAETQGVLFFHETTVMDGTPIFNLAEETLPMCKIKEIKGILNTTTNFVLEEMARGKSFDEAITEGRKRGFVEADPSMDIEGWDAAAKTAALMNVLMDADITPMDIQRQGIEGIDYADILEAEKEGKVIKLICHGRIEDGKAIGTVKPMKIEKGHTFANITGTSSVLTLKTDLMGEITIVEHEPEIEQTGYGLFGDLLRLSKKLK